MTSNDPDLTDAAPCGSHGSRPALAMSASSLGGLDWTEVLKHRKWHHDSDQSGRVRRWSWTCGGVRAHSDRSCLPGPASPADTQNMFWCQNPEDHSSFMSFRNLNLFNLSSHQCFSNVSSHRIASRGFKKNLIYQLWGKESADWQGEKTLTKTKRFHLLKKNHQKRLWCPFQGFYTWKNRQRLWPRRSSSPAADQQGATKALCSYEQNFCTTFLQQRCHLRCCCKDPAGCQKILPRLQASSAGKTINLPVRISLFQDDGPGRPRAAKPPNLCFRKLQASQLLNNKTHLIRCSAAEN